MMRPLFFIFLLLSEIVAAQSTGQTIVVKQVPGSGYQFINQKTKSPVNKLFWDEAEPFVNGYARVLLKNKFSFVNTKGDPIAPVEFDAARNFSNKLAAVNKNSKWGFINESGKVIIPFQYEIVFDFKETVTAVLANKKWSLINMNGQVIKALDITVFYGFKKGIAKIEKDGVAGTMNTRGEIILTKENKIPVSNRMPYIPRSTGATSSVCPDNIDFEYGSFLNWKCFRGSVDSVGNTNVITVNPSPPTNNRHTIYNRTMPSALDPYGLFPVNPPDGSNFALRLGNTNIGAEAEQVRYSIHVPVNDSNFAIKYDYAVVFQDPGHTTWTQPRFEVKLFDSAANVYVDCASFEYISTSNLPGFALSTVDTSVIYKPWASVFVSLRGYAGKTMFLEFTNADCVRRGHWGYAYVDVEKPCGQSVQVEYECNPPNETTLDAPPGFQLYNWWDSSFTVQYGTGQHFVMNPGPPVNSTVWLEMIPFNDFGCRDTIPVTITGVFNADFSLADSNAVCAPHSFTFYNSNAPFTSATWDFGDGGTATGDTVTHIFMLPGNYTVTLDVILPSGCVGTIQKIVSVLEPVGSFYFDGSTSCNIQQVTFDAVVNNADSLFWDFGDGVILATTQTTVTHTYTTPGIYIPFLTVQSDFGCHNTVPGPDTIKIEKLRPGFFEAQQKICGSTTVNLTDTSYSFFGIISYDWDFGDGNTGTGNNVSHSYTTTGTYNISLTITGINGCVATLVKPVFVQVNERPDATIAGPLTECFQVPVTFTSSIISADAINYIHWTCSNGDTGSGSSLTVNFALAGNYTVQLIVGTVNGCYDTTNHSITIYPAPDVTQPNDQSLCDGYTTVPIYFAGPVVGTTYTWTNDNPSIGLAANGSGNIPAFIADNNTSTPITATVTVTPSANGCPGPAKTFTITVNPTVDVDQPNNQLLCKNDPTSAIIFGSNVSGATFAWTNNNTLIGLAASGTGDIPSFTAINNTTLPVIATIAVSAHANGCPGAVKIFTITVNPMPAVTQPVNQIVCNGASTTLVPFATAVSGAVFNWTNDNTSIGLASSGSGNINAFTAVNNANAPVTATISVSAIANGCPGPSTTFTITVNPGADIMQPADQVICNGLPSSAVTLASSVSGATFSWTNDNPGIGLAANGSGDIPVFTAINNSNVPILANIAVTSAANGCPGQTKNFTITVNPTANVLQPQNQLVCNGTTTAAINFSGNLTGTNFTWTNDNTSIGLLSGGSGDIPPFIVINTINTAVTSNITVTPSGATCPGAPKTFSITAKPTPTVVRPADQSLCNGSSIQAVDFNGTVSNTSYSWTNSNTSIGLAANGIGDIAAFNGINTGSNLQTAMITVTPVANNCPGFPEYFMIIVKPTPMVDQIAAQSLCNGIATTAIQLTSSQGNSTISWANNNTSIGLAANGNGDIPVFTAVNNTNTPVTAIVTATASADGCSGPVTTIAITVHPTPTIIANNNANVCLGSNAQLSASGAATYSWSPAGGLSCTNCPNPVSTPVDTTRYVVEGTSSAGCIAYDSVLLSVIKPFQMLVSPNDTLCIGETTDLHAMQANSYLWSPPAGLSNTHDASPAATPTATTTYTVVGYDPYGCFTDTGHVTITVGPKPTVEIGNDITTQTGGSITLNPSITNGPIIEWLWTPATDLGCTDCATPLANIRDNITYTVTLKNIYGCTATDRISIHVFCESAQVFIPNAFTPDGDGLNDILMVRGSGITVKSFRIFSRWGELVFEKKNFNPNDPRFGWDGKVRGVPATPDVFVYTAEVVCDNGIVYTYKGNTTVLK